jgi:peptide/nickel transport system ATP-binding protein
MSLLEITDLTVDFDTEDGLVQAVKGISLTLEEGEILAICGESGCGKSVTAMSVPRLLPADTTRLSGSVKLDGNELTELPEQRMRQIRGKDVSVVFQEPMTSLNPSFSVGYQIVEVLRRHEGLSRKAATDRAVELLELVGIPLPRRRLKEYPHQLSGGMRQRVMIAIAVACSPRVLIADEPTTALDVTIQAGVLDVFRDLRDRLGTAIILITHDLGVVADIADRAVVMYAGRAVEQAGVDELFAQPRHPYTLGLMKALPSAATGGRLAEIPGMVPSPLSDPGEAPASTAGARPPGGLLPPGRAATVILQIDDLVKHYGQVRAVDGLSLSIGEGEVLGLVGESGSGKSTVGKCVLRLTEPTSGSISLNGRDITHLSRRAMRPLRRDVHMVFQDPYSSLNPRFTIEQIVGEPLLRHGVAGRREVTQRVATMLEQVGLRSEMRSRFPHELSGGQRQRVGLARALILEPKLVVADEPVSALDVSVQASVLNLITDLQREMGFSCLFITHDLSVVEFLADRIAVMYLGRIVESGPTAEIFAEPRHPYTQALLSAAPVADPVRQRERRRIVLGGDVPSPVDPPSGCRFHTRCPLAFDACRTEEPLLADPRTTGHLAACHLVTADRVPDAANT